MDPKSDGSAVISPPADAAGVPSQANPAGITRELRLRPKPSPIFKGKNFFIMPGLPSHFVANLRDEIELWGGLVNPLLEESHFVLHIGTEQNDRVASDLVARLHQVAPPKIRSYHWFFACIHARPPKPLPKSEFIKAMPIFTMPVKGDQEERMRPIAFYLTKNMPICVELHETSSQQALMAVAASIEVRGGEISRTRAKADVLVLDLTYDQAQKFVQQMRPDQEALKREQLKKILERKKPYQPKFLNVAQNGMDDGRINKANKSLRGGRTEYTPADDTCIVRWLTYHYPERTNWKSLSIYQTLCDPTHAKHLPWATRHSAQSWHEHVRKRLAAFAVRADKLKTEGVALDRNLRTRAERAKAGIREDRDQEPIVEGEGARASPDDMEVDDRPNRKVDKGKRRETNTQDDSRTEETDSFAASQDQSEALEGHRSKRVKHLDQNILENPAPVQAPEQSTAREIRISNSEDDAAPVQKTAHPESKLGSAQTSNALGGSSPPDTAGDNGVDLGENPDTARASNDVPSNPSIDPFIEHGQTVEIPQGDAPDIANWTMKGVKSMVNSLLGSKHADVVPQSPSHSRVKSMVNSLLGSVHANDDLPHSPTHSQAYTEDNSMDYLDDDLIADQMLMELKIPAHPAMPTSEELRNVAQAGPSRRTDVERPGPAEEAEQRGGNLPSGRNSAKLSESERRVNDLVLDDPFAAQGEPVDQEAETMIVVTRTETTSTVITRAEPEPPVTIEASPQPNRAPVVPPATSAPRATAKPATVAKKRIANPQRAAELIKSTVDRYGVDIKTVLSAMKDVAAANPEGKIDVNEVWQLIAEGKKRRP